ncbi:hypothetical protein [Accumulibacter sp.]|uniref:hypothetical protein n=1 Tax=Accumulibacter sp. TaxID=2053492 RepID=UPI0028C3FF3A|nr:hypothetical protein [Accumulibacter sp.]
MNKATSNYAMPRMRPCRAQLAALGVLLALELAGSPAYAADAALQKYPDVLAATVQPRGGDRFNFDVTLSSPYDTPQRYADAFRVMGRDGSVYGERTLFHDHASEQPFTRDLYDMQVPGGVRAVIIEGRDKTFGYGGKTIEVVLPGR